MIFRKITTKYFKYKKIKGFSLVETLMAILILTLSIMAPLALAMQTVRYSRIATQKMEATYLAEEAVEIIYNVKKSAEIYCGVSPEDSRCNGEYFNDYFLDQNPTDSNDRIIDSNCYGRNVGGSRKYCNIDYTSVVYDNNSKKTFLKIIDPNMRYVAKTTNGLALATSTQTFYKRSFNVTRIDNNTRDGGGRNHSALITSIVCIQEAGNCDENSENKIMIQNIVSR